VTAPLRVTLAGRDLLRISDLVPAEAEAILDLAVEMKAGLRPLAPGSTIRSSWRKHPRPSWKALVRASRSWKSAWSGSRSDLPTGNERRYACRLPVACVRRGTLVTRTTTTDNREENACRWTS
jgi:hypothetical protein